MTDAFRNVHAHFDNRCRYQTSMPSRALGPAANRRIAQSLSSADIRPCKASIRRPPQRSVRELRQDVLDVRHGCCLLFGVKDIENGFKAVEV